MKVARKTVFVYNIKNAIQAKGIANHEIYKRYLGSKP